MTSFTSCKKPEEQEACCGTVAQSTLEFLFHGWKESPYKVLFLTGVKVISSGIAQSFRCHSILTPLLTTRTDRIRNLTVSSYTRKGRQCSVAWSCAVLFTSPSCGNCASSWGFGSQSHINLPFPSHFLPW